MSFDEIFPTIKVKHVDFPNEAYVIIEERSFDPEKHELYEGPEAAPKPSQKVEPILLAGITKKGKR